jgi:hypothetical protein
MPPAPRSTAYRGLQEECRGVWYGTGVRSLSRPRAATSGLRPATRHVQRREVRARTARRVFFFGLVRSLTPSRVSSTDTAARDRWRWAGSPCRVPSLPRSRQSLSISGRGSASDLDDGDPARGVVFAAHGLVPGRPPTVSPSLGPTGGQVHRLMIGAGQTQRVSSVGSCSYAVYRPCTPARAGRFGRSALVAWFHVKLAS